MKKFLIFAIGLLSSASAVAEEGFYFGVGYNKTEVSDNTDSTTGDGFSLSFGHTFKNSSFMFTSSELQYIDLGTYNGTSAESYSWNLKPSFPINNLLHFSLVGGINYVYTETKNSDEDDWALSYGAEVGYRIIKQVEMNVGYMQTNSNDKYSILYSELQLRF